MNRDDLRERLFVLARDRLQNTPGDFDLFTRYLDTWHGLLLVEGVRLDMRPLQSFAAAAKGAPALENTKLLQIIDEWSDQQPVRQAIEPLPPRQSGHARRPAEVPPVVSAAADQWMVRKPKRERGPLAGVLYRLLLRVNKQGDPLPSPREVLELLRADTPRPITDVQADGFTYEGDDGKLKTYTLKDIGARIKQLTTRETA
jgi:hypothetical protein